MIQFEVKDMSCGHCVATITEAVKAVDPAATVTTDLATRRVGVDSKQEPARIQAAIEAAGYGTVRR